MKINNSHFNIGLQTDLITLPQATRVIRHAHYLYFETPTRPDFTYGNSVFFLGSSLEENKKYIAEYQSDNPKLNSKLAHFEYPFNYFEGHSEFKSYEDIEIVFQFESSTPDHLMPFNIRFTAIQPEELLQCISTLVFDEYSEGLPDEFLIWRLEDYRDKILRKEGKWYGLFHADELISTCGIFSSMGYSRFQMVITKKPYQRLGYGTYLLKSILKELNKDQKIVIMASNGSIASMMYPKIGFQKKSVILSTKI